MDELTLPVQPTDRVTPDGNEWRDSLMVHDWPEHGPGGITFEELYQAFKARYEAEKAVPSEYVPCPNCGPTEVCLCWISPAPAKKENERG